MLITPRKMVNRGSVIVSGAHLRGVRGWCQVSIPVKFLSPGQKSKKRLYLHPLRPSPTVSQGCKGRNGRVVDCGGLENRCPGDWTGGSNPSFSAKHSAPFRLQAEGTFILRQCEPGLPERAITENKGLMGAARESAVVCRSPRTGITIRQPAESNPLITEGYHTSAHA